MNEYLKANQARWNELTPLHERSDFYDIEGFKAGRSTLMPIELSELGDVSGKSLLHLQCHFGLDTMSWAREGAQVTGVDFSEEAISLARRLSEETGIEAEFLCSDVYELSDILFRQFDIVFTSYGVLAWLPDMDGWADVVQSHLTADGVFHMVEDHPFAGVLETQRGSGQLQVVSSYFGSLEPIRYDGDGSYADREARVANPSYQWQHSLESIIAALTRAGLRIEFLHEFPVCAWRRFPGMWRDDAGWWRLKGDPVPLTFSVKAKKGE